MGVVGGGEFKENVVGFYISVDDGLPFRWRGTIRV